MSNATPLPSTSTLCCFESAAKHQSFTAAAEELGLTQSGVSRQVKALEDELGTILFRREGRGIRLTQAGKSFAEAISADLSRLRNSVSRTIAAGETNEVLSIAVLPTFGARWLVPRLNKFKEKHPTLNMMLHSRRGPFDLLEQSIDVAIHFGTNDWPGASLAALCPEDLVIVASPKMTNGKTSLAPIDILKLRKLHLTTRPDLWHRFAQSHQIEATREGDHFDQLAFCISAAVNGLGAAILPTYLIEEELASSALIALASLDDRDNKNYFIATPAGRQSKNAKAFIAWLKTQVSKRA